MHVDSHLSIGFASVLVPYAPIWSSSVWPTLQIRIQSSSTRSSPPSSITRVHARIHATRSRPLGRKNAHAFGSSVVERACTLTRALCLLSVSVQGEARVPSRVPPFVCNTPTNARLEKTCLEMLWRRERTRAWCHLMGRLSG